MLFSIKNISQNRDYYSKTFLKKLYLKFSTEDKQTMDLVVDILKTYSGKIQVAVQCSTNNKLYSLPYKVDGSAALLNELYAVLSEDCIKLI